MQGSSNSRSIYSERKSNQGSMDVERGESFAYVGEVELFGARMLLIAVTALGGVLGSMAVLGAFS